MDIEQKTINWFPGHMAKARRLLQEQLRRADLVIEVCDARLPYSSRNPELIHMTANKTRLLIINKSDLADPDRTKEWLAYFRSRGEQVMTVNSLTLKSKAAIGIIDKMTREMVEKAKERGIRKTIRAVVVGVPNAGKSTIINRIRGNSIVRTGDRPGVTKSTQWIRITPYLELMDSPGMLWPRLDDQDAAMKLCWIGSVKDDISDLPLLTISLLESLKSHAPDEMKSRFHLPDLSASGVELLDAVCAGRGWLLKGSQYDYDRCCNVVLDEFRSGKLGRITLEKVCEGVRNPDEGQKSPCP